MRLLVEVSGRVEDWQATISVTGDRPRLPLPFSCSAAFVAEGHEISAINFSNPSFAESAQGIFRRLYGSRELSRALGENDLAFFWASSAIRGIAAGCLRPRCRRKVLFGSYVWQAPPSANWNVRKLMVATRLAAKWSRGIVVITEEQRREAICALGQRVPVVKFTWGIDSVFYRAPSSGVPPVGELPREVVTELLSAPYVILAGDQQRLDNDAVELVERHGIRLVRVPQERETAAWYRSQIAKRRLQGRLFVFERVSYPALRFLLQHALAYVGLVDSTWQPAGWTVLCESLASGTPAVVYEGLTTREMRVLGAGDYLYSVPHRSLDVVATKCQIIHRNRSDLSNRAQMFARDLLDLKRTAPAFVRQVERIYRSEPIARSEI